MRSFSVVLKKIVLPSTVVILCAGWNARERAEMYGAKASINVHVTDENGGVVSNAEVEVYFGLSVREGKTVKGISDGRGCFAAEGNTTGDVYVNIRKKGFYNTAKKLELYKDEEREVCRGHWMPDVIVTNVVLRKIGNPIPLSKVNGTIPIPLTNTWLGFDMAIKDFTAPYGKGKETDFEVLFQWDGKPQPYSSYYSLDIRSYGKGTGAYRSVRYNESESQWVHGANEDGYEPLKIHLFRRRLDRNFEREEFDQQHPLVYRSRCKFDGNGNLISANYSLIVGISCSASWQDKGLLSLACLFNSVVNDRNLEDQTIYNTPNYRRIGGLE